MSHFDSTQHPLACKLGTLTPEGSGDIYCYLCNDEVSDPNLGSHLANFGLNVDNVEKTEKSLAELVK